MTLYIFESVVLLDCIILSAVPFCPPTVQYTKIKMKHYNGFLSVINKHTEIHTHTSKHGISYKAASQVVYSCSCLLPQTDTVNCMNLMISTLKMNGLTDDESYFTVLVIKAAGHHGRYSVVNHG